MREYIAWFNAELTNIEGYKGSFAIATLSAGLLLGHPLWKLITKRPLKDNVDLLERAQKYITIEDMDLVRRSLK